MLKLSTLTSRAKFLGAAVVFGGIGLATALQPILVSADQVTVRSLALSSSAVSTAVTGDPGSATNGQKVTYTFTFTPATSGDIQSWSAMICTTAFGYLDGSGVPLALGSPCTAPAGFTALNLAGITPVVTVGGSPSAGWTLGTAGANVIRISHATPVTVSDSTPVVISFPADATHYVTNPSSEMTFFAHMDTYSDASYATKVDDGTVANATSVSIGLTTKVQETLKFSVGVATSGGALVDPSTTCVALSSGNNGNTLTLGDAQGALNPSNAYSAHSYFRVSTNSSAGTAIQYAGNTLKSGTAAMTAKNTIDPIGAGVASTTGTEQFGLGIDKDDTTTYGFDFVNDDSNPSLVTQSGYDASGTGANVYSFVNTEDSTNGTTYHKPQTLAASTGNIDCSTGSVKYVANIRNNTEAGIYRTSINYIAVPKY